MDATRIIAIRHGETAWNVDTRIQGQLDIPLNGVGEWQAQQVATALAEEPVAAVYTSDLRRAHGTALPLASTRGITAQLETGLRERGFGSLEGMTFAEIEHQLPEQARRWRTREPDYVPEGGGESLLQFRERVTDTLDRLAARHAGEQIVVVGHGGVMDVLYRAATGQELQAPRTWKLGNAAINRLLWTPQGLALVGWADDTHLQRTERDEFSA
ncbi:MAG: histidine phosphatase family protein [Pseudomonadota bacterium]